MKIYQIVACLMLIAFVGCVGFPVAVGPGDKPDAVPPKIVKGTGQSATLLTTKLTTEDNRSWDRPNAFGPVPPELQDTGNKICGAIDMKAIGYHPRAIDENGNEFQGGGYLCGRNK